MVGPLFIKEKNKDLAVLNEIGIIKKKYRKYTCKNKKYLV